MNFSSWVILLAAAMISASIAFSNHYGILALTEWVLRSSASVRSRGNV